MRVQLHVVSGHSFTVLSVWDVLVSFLVFSPTLLPLLFLLQCTLLFITIIIIITIIIVITIIIIIITFIGYCFYDNFHGVLALFDGCSDWG